ncbi:alpha/beta fold hydrolase [Microlunatus soli]|uniref:Pimeloyl-ACP methyl ester carboxylesterase n=1 Tax=Microlunatus soli TaxID=630515 RepID=A0A1H1ZV14_9ACTN|nr:alpha/beta fold hydrolase [Microlunatus soli]SDT37222.1 Pimeloyl-ACP methyl ester carboxylesterase [Microlunatus soli]
MPDPSDPLVLLPGMNCSAALWDAVLPGLPAAVHVVHGRLEQPTIDGCVDDLLDQLPSRFALAGLSLGGIVAMALIRRAPERVTRLCLLATNARAPTAAQLTGWQEEHRRLAAGETARQLQRDLLPVLTAHRTAALDEAICAMADDIGDQILDTQLAAQATRIDERPALHRVAVPTLVLAAADDALCPVDRHREISAAVPGSRLQILPDIGHLSPLEAPGLISAAVVRWLNRRGSRPGSAPE